MKRDKRLLWGAIAAAAVCFGTAFGLNVFYNEAHAARALDRTTFQTLILALFALTLLALLAAIRLWATMQDEVVRTADRVSLYWGWTLGAFVWLMTPWSSLPEYLVDPLSNPGGDTLFTLSEAAGAYMGGGVTLMLIVSACYTIINAVWWLAKR